MSDTPRTSEWIYELTGRSEKYAFDAMTGHARQLERELADIKARHAWRPIETAPKGSVTENFGERGVSKWFIGLLDNGERLQMRRLPSTFDYDFETPDVIYYAAFRVVGWQPLPEPPKEGAE